MKTSNVKHRPAKNKPSFVTTLEHFSQPVGNMEAAEELIAMGGRLLFHDDDVLMINRCIRTNRENIAGLRKKLGYK